MKRKEAFAQPPIPWLQLLCDDITEYTTYRVYHLRNGAQAHQNGPHYSAPFEFIDVVNQTGNSAETEAQLQQFVLEYLANNPAR